MLFKKLILCAILILLISCNQNIIEREEIIYSTNFVTNNKHIVRVHFDFDKFVLTKDFIETDILTDLRTNNNIKKLYIYGHTDNKGKAWYNYRLGNQRAQTVKNIISTNYPLENIILKSYGHSNAIADNNTELGRYSNRRADVYIDLVEESITSATNIVEIKERKTYSFNILPILIIIIIIILVILFLMFIKINGTLSLFDAFYIKITTGWSFNIIKTIKDKKQFKIYKDANLRPERINGRECLIKKIDPNYVDPKTGYTNRELMEKGRSPKDSRTGEIIELHHSGQEFDSPFVELCENSEHGDGNDTILHQKNKASWRGNPEKEKQYDRQREEHWKERARQLDYRS